MALNQSRSLTSSQETMREVAAETGGKPYMNQNEIRLGVALAAAEDKGSYAIGYYPESKKWDGKYRSIKVKVARGDTETLQRLLDDHREINASIAGEGAAAGRRGRHERDHFRAGAPTAV